MNKHYFNIGMYDVMFLDNIIKRGIEIYLSDKITNVIKNNNTYSCNVIGTKLYNVSITFNDRENYKIDDCKCTCPFFTEDKYRCKHIYALLLKIKFNYNFDNIEKDIVFEFNKIRDVFKENDKQYRFYRFKNKYNNYVKYFNDSINSYKIKLSNLEKRLEEDKNIVNLIILLKDSIKLRSDLYYKVMELSNTNKSDYTNNNNYNLAEDNDSSGIFETFVDIMNSINLSENKKEQDLENERQRYRNAIVEQNLYDGKTYEDLYDELNGDK